jgi:hypothetical protein
MTSVAPQDIGKASGTFSTLRRLGGSFGVAVLVAVFASTGSYSSVLIPAHPPRPLTRPRPRERTSR